MAVQDRASPSNKDLESIAQARSIAAAARKAQSVLAELSQEQIAAIVTAMAEAVTPQAEALARLAVEETGYGVVADKVQKNLFSSRQVYEFIRPMKTVGVVNRIDEKKIIEIGEPFGVVAAIVPSTNPTSTAIYKVLIALKARWAIVVSPHPAAARCITRSVEIMCDAAGRAGAAVGSIGWMTNVTLEGTEELMKQRDLAVILANGGMGLVRAAYSSGKPAYGVGPGNAPCYIERSADLAKAASDIMIGKTFDNGVLCSSPNSVVVDEDVAEQVRRQFVSEGAYFMNAAEMEALAKGLTTGLDPAMTLGCGGWGGNITSDNISPRHLLNIKRLAYELRPAARTGARPESLPLPKAPARPEPAGIPAQALAARIDSFLESRGYHAPADKEDHSRTAQGVPVDKPAAFVCEDDVRAAIKAGRKVLIDAKTIVTPSARDLGEAQKLFVPAGWAR